MGTRNTVITVTPQAVILYLRKGTINAGVLELASVEDAESIGLLWELSNPFTSVSIVDKEVNTLFGKELLNGN